MSLLTLIPVLRKGFGDYFCLDFAKEEIKAQKNINNFECDNSQKMTD